MTPEEKVQLIRLEERDIQRTKMHDQCTIPARLAAIERQLNRVEGGIALLVLLVTLGRLYDYYGAYLPHATQILVVGPLHPFYSQVLQLLNYTINMPLS